jgi:hypothetical protein
MKKRNKKQRCSTWDVAATVLGQLARFDVSKKREPGPPPMRFSYPSKSNQ